jgi:hypothetical protein
VARGLEKGGGNNRYSGVKEAKALLKMVDTQPITLWLLQPRPQ